MDNDCRCYNFHILIPFLFSAYICFKACRQYFFSQVRPERTDAVSDQFAAGCPVRKEALRAAGSPAGKLGQLHPIG